MTLPAPHILAAIALGVVLLAELWHLRRVRRLAPLAFTSRRTPVVVWLAVPLRAAGVAAVVWGASMLLDLQPQRVDADPPTNLDEDVARRLLIVLDVSPSMSLDDAGPDAAQTRSGRIGELLLDAVRRLPLGKVRASVVAFYTDGKPVAVDTTDYGVIENILDDLPLDNAFEPGPSELFLGLDSAFDVARDWPHKSTALVIASDGDVVPASGMPRPPASIAETLVVGVGNPASGSFIAGRQSRQDASALRQVARRLGGTYVDGNRLPLPPGILSTLRQEAASNEKPPRGLREWAILAVVAGGGTIALVPLALAILARGPRRFDKVSLAAAP